VGVEPVGVGAAAADAAVFVVLVEEGRQDDVPAGRAGQVDGDVDLVGVEGVGCVGDVGDGHLEFLVSADRSAGQLQADIGLARSRRRGKRQQGYGGE